MNEVTDMTIAGLKRIRAAALAAPVLLTGCVVVPDGSDGFHGRYPVPAVSAGIYTTYGPGYHARPLPPVHHFHRPPPTVIVRPPPVVVVPAPRPHAFAYRNFDHPSHLHRGHGGYSAHDGRRSDDERRGHGHGNRNGNGGDRGDRGDRGEHGNGRGGR
ncbi:MAG: hypothetical protein K2W80_09420 [Burkholderiales bacterium]|nr:hypothetical protein [Burkholderiales bacterium]